jgi:hypothetical protein
MSSPGTSRFRFLARDGTEVKVASVEELSRRLEAGELGPETSLFDAGTGRWARAGDVPVFQFVREELRAEGRLPEEEPEIVMFPELPPGSPIEPAADFDPIRHDEPHAPRPLAPPTVDPFEFHLPLSNPMDPLEGQPPTPPSGSRPDEASESPPGDLSDPPPEAPAAGDAEEPDGSEEDEERVAQEPWFEDRPRALSPEATTAAGVSDPDEAWPRGEPGPGDDDDVDTLETGLDRLRRQQEVEDPDIDASPLHAWLTQGASPPGAAASSEGSAHDSGRYSRADRREADEPPFPSGAAGSPDAVGSDQEPPLQIRTAWEDASDADDPRATWIAARRQRRNTRVLAGVAVLLILVVGGAAIVTSVRTPVNGGASAQNGPPGNLASEAGAEPGAGPAGFVALEGVELPPDLEELANFLWLQLPGQIDLLVDSIRVEAGLPEAPPREWLSGFYLANAGQFESVVEFWETYRVFVEELASGDAELLQTAAARVLEGRASGSPEAEPGSSTPADRARLLAYVMARQERMRDARLDRYLHLGRTAQAALELHGFLERNTDAISHSPAIGRGVSSDPVLEAVIETPEVRREMEQHLDRIFEALDRTRRGGQPSLAGLRMELFGSLGRPL